MSLIRPSRTPLYATILKTARLLSRLHLYPCLYVSYQQQCFYLTADMPKTSFTFTFFVDIFFSYFERRCRGVVRLSIPPKAAYFEGRCRGVVPFSSGCHVASRGCVHLEGFSLTEGRCREVVRFRV